MPSKSKNKGNKHERDVAKLLTEWWGAPFQRTPNSGALRWNGASWTYGDLLVPEDFLAVVECKHYKTIDLDAVLRCAPAPNNILGWWLEVTADVLRCYEETGMVVQPILIYKANNRPQRIALSASLWRELAIYRKIPSSVFHGREPESFAIMGLEPFLGVVDRETFQRALGALQ